MFLSNKLSRFRQLFRRPWALLLVGSAMLMVACDEEITVTETTDTTQEEVVADSEAAPGAIVGTELPAASPTENAATTPPAKSERKAVPTSEEVKAKAEAQVQTETPPEVSLQDEDMPEWIKWQSPVLDVPSLPRDATTVDYSLYPKVDNANLSEFDMVRYEGIGSVLFEGGGEKLDFLMGHCYQSSCRETYMLGLSQVAANEFETEWSVEVIGLRKFKDQPSTWDVKPAATSVLCSTTRPLVVDFDGEEYVLNHISASSPRSYYYSGLDEIDSLYWKVCHDLENVIPSELPEIASNLGYDLNAESKTVQQDFIELLEP